MTELDTSLTKWGLEQTHTNFRAGGCTDRGDIDAEKIGQHDVREIILPFHFDGGALTSHKA